MNHRLLLHLLLLTNQINGIGNHFGHVRSRAHACVETCRATGGWDVHFWKAVEVRLVCVGGPFN
jgi:hypothetical protein